MPRIDSYAIAGVTIVGPGTRHAEVTAQVQLTTGGAAPLQLLMVRLGSGEWRLFKLRYGGLQAF